MVFCMREGLCAHVAPQAVICPASLQACFLKQPGGAAGRRKLGNRRVRFSAQVGEWLKPTDCKSVPPSEVRRFESFPVHQVEPLSRREWSKGLLAISRAFCARELK